jgi:hypothetical protein
VATIESTVQVASGALGAFGGFNSRELDYATSFNGSSENGTVVWDVTGDVAQGLLGGRQLQSANVPIDAPVSVHLNLFACARATLRQVGSPPSTGINALMAVGSGATQGRGHGPEDNSFISPVFDLPDGFTANSVSMGLVDNHLISIPVPEPSSLALWIVAGLAVLAWVLRRRLQVRTEA